MCRYRIDGAALREAMQSSRQSLPSENASGRSDEGARQGPNVRKSAAELLDVVDMLQGWTGALQASQQQLQQVRGGFLDYVDWFLDYVP